MLVELSAGVDQLPAVGGPPAELVLVPVLVPVLKSAGVDQLPAVGGPPAEELVVPGAVAFELFPLAKVLLKCSVWFQMRKTSL